MRSKSHVVTVLAVLALASSLPGAVRAQNAPSHYENYNVWDGFEGSDRASTWFFDGQGVRLANFYGGSSAYEGYYYAKLAAGAGSWSSVGRIVGIPSSNGPWDVLCKASFQVNAALKTKVNVEVIDVDTWTYVAFKTYTLNANSGYQLLSVPTWKGRWGDVYVRLAIGEGKVRVDDMKTSCTL
jgi:hypothetical protein